MMILLLLIIVGFAAGWWDPITMAWNAVKNAEVRSIPPVEANAPGASLYVPLNWLPERKRRSVS